MSLCSLEDLSNTIRKLNTLKFNVSVHVSIDVVGGLGSLMLKELGALLQHLESYEKILQHRARQIEGNIREYINTSVNVSRRLIEETIPLNLQGIIVYHEDKASFKDNDSGYFEMSDLPTTIRKGSVDLSRTCSMAFVPSNLAGIEDRRSVSGSHSIIQRRSPEIHRQRRKRLPWIQSPEDEQRQRRRLSHDDGDIDSCTHSISVLPEARTLDPAPFISTGHIGIESESGSKSSNQQFRETVYSWIEEPNSSLSDRPQSHTMLTHNRTQAPSSILLY
jgi:hypothetical protein